MLQIVWESVIIIMIIKLGSLFILFVFIELLTVNPLHPDCVFLSRFLLIQRPSFLFWFFLHCFSNPFSKVIVYLAL